MRILLEELYKDSKIKRPVSQGLREKGQNNPDLAKSAYNTGWDWQTKYKIGEETNRENATLKRGRPNTSPKQKSRNIEASSRLHSNDGSRFIVKKCSGVKRPGGSAGSRAASAVNRKKGLGKNIWVKKSWKKKELDLFESLMTRYGIKPNEDKRPRSKMIKTWEPSESQKLIEAYENPESSNLKEKTHPKDEKLSGHEKIQQSPLGKYPGTIKQANNNHKRVLFLSQKAQKQNRNQEAMGSSHSPKPKMQKREEESENQPRRIIGKERMPEISLNLVEKIESRIQDDQDEDELSKEMQNESQRETERKENWSQHEENDKKIKKSSQSIEGNGGQGQKNKSEKEIETERVQEEQNDEKYDPKDESNCESEQKKSRKNLPKENEGKIYDLKEEKFEEKIYREKSENHSTKKNESEENKTENIDEKPENKCNNLKESLEPNEPESSRIEITEKEDQLKLEENEEESSGELSGEAGELFRQYEENLNWLKPKKEEEETLKKSGIATPKFNNEEFDVKESQRESQDSSNGKSIENQLLDEEINGGEMTCLEEQEEERRRDNEDIENLGESGGPKSPGFPKINEEGIEDSARDEARMDIREDDSGKENEMHSLANGMEEVEKENESLFNGLESNREERYSKEEDYERDEDGYEDDQDNENASEEHYNDNTERDEDSNENYSKVEEVDIKDSDEERDQRPSENASEKYDRDSEFDQEF